MRDEPSLEFACSPARSAHAPDASPKGAAPRSDLDDELEIDGELPPHDDAPRTEDRAEGPRGEPDEGGDRDLDDEEPGGLDASVSDDLPIGEAAIVDDARGEEHGDAAGLDVPYDATADLAHFEDGPLRDEERGFADEFHGVEDDPRTSADDGGAEGTSEDIGAEVDESALPELDADDGGTFDLGDFMRELRAEGLGHEASGERWVVYEGWGAPVPCAALVVDHGRVLAAGAELCVIDPAQHAARRHGLPRRATAIAASPAGAVVGTSRGVILATSAAGAAPAIMSLLETERPVRALAVFSGRTWALVGEELWQVASPPAPAVVARNAVVALVQATGAILGVSRRGETTIERFRGDDGDWEVLPIPEGARRLVSTTEPKAIAVCGASSTFALATSSEVFVSREGGARTTEIDLDDVLALAFAGSDASSKLLVAARKGEALIVVSVDDRGRTALEGELDLGSLGDPEDPDARVAIAWDDTREALFVATPRGLFAVGPKRTH